MSTIFLSRVRLAWRTLSWADLDERLSISITVTEPDAEPPVLDEPLVHAADQGLVVVDRIDTPITDGELMQVHLRHDAINEERCVCRCVQTYELTDPEPVRRFYVQIDAQAPWSAAARLRGLVDDLLASVQQEQRP